MHANNIQIILLRLKNGSRLLRLTEPETGLALERALNPSRPVLQQKQQFKAMFEAMIQHSEVLVGA